MTLPIVRPLSNAVDGERSVQLLGGHLRQPSVGEGARVVHQDVDAAQIPYGLLHSLYRGIRMRQVSLDDRGAAPPALIWWATRCAWSAART